MRSAGGWAAVKALRAAKVFEKSDERILGDGDFVESVLVAVNEAMERKYDLQSRGFTLTLSRRCDIYYSISHVMLGEDHRE